MRTYQSTGETALSCYVIVLYFVDQEVPCQPLLKHQVCWTMNLEQPVSQVLCMALYICAIHNQMQTCFSIMTPSATSPAPPAEGLTPACAYNMTHT